MDTSKLSLGEQIAAVSGIALLIILFLPWYGVEVSGSVGNVSLSNSASASAWEAFGFVDILLFVIALLAIGIPVARMTDSLPEDIPAATILLGAGAVALLLVLWRIIDLPTPDSVSFGGASVDFGRKIGVFLGLMAAGGIAYGGWRAMEESPVGSAPAAAPPPPPPADPPAPEPPAATG